MLTLKRRVGQKTMLDLLDGTRIVVQVVEANGQNVKLGFDAPLHVKITREEILGNESRPVPKAVTS